MKNGILMTALVLLTMIAAAQAGYTEVYPEQWGELGHEAILENLYGQAYLDGQVTATRVHDNGLEGPLNLVTSRPGDATDRVWTDGIANLSIQAVFAVYDQQFGYWTEDEGYVPLVDAVTLEDHHHTTGFEVEGTGSVKFQPGQQWLWVRHGKGGTFYSDPEMNPFGLDHMVTYYIEGLEDGATTWLLFWEDMKGPYPMSDRDLNDLVVEIKAYPIPAPAAILLGGIGLALVRGLKKKHQ